MTDPSPVDARHLTAESDWEAIAEWCRGVVQTEEGERVVLTTMGGAPEGTWIVATPGGPFSHAVYADKDYRGYLALLARRQAADARRGRRDDLVRVALGVMVAAGTSVGDEDLAVLAHAAVGALLPGMSGD